MSHFQNIHAASHVNNSDFRLRSVSVNAMTSLLENESYCINSKAGLCFILLELTLKRKDMIDYVNSDQYLQAQQF